MQCRRDSIVCTGSSNWYQIMKYMLIIVEMSDSLIYSVLDFLAMSHYQMPIHRSGRPSKQVSPQVFIYIFLVLICGFNRILINQMLVLSVVTQLLQLLSISTFFVFLSELSLKACPLN